MAHTYLFLILALCSSLSVHASTKRNTPPSLNVFHKGDNKQARFDAKQAAALAAIQHKKASQKQTLCRLPQPTIAVAPYVVIKKPSKPKARNKRQNKKTHAADVDLFSQEFPQEQHPETQEALEWQYGYWMYDAYKKESEKEYYMDSLIAEVANLYLDADTELVLPDWCSQELPAGYPFSQWITYKGPSKKQQLVLPKHVRKEIKQEKRLEKLRMQEEHLQKQKNQDAQDIHTWLKEDDENHPLELFLTRTEEEEFDSYQDNMHTKSEPPKDLADYIDQFDYVRQFLHRTDSRTHPKYKGRRYDKK